MADTTHALPGSLARVNLPRRRELLFGTEGNRLRRFDVDTIGNPKLLDDVFIESASDGETGGPGPTTPGGRDINGMICRFPDGSGRFLAGEDTGQIAIRPGWVRRSSVPRMRALSIRFLMTS